MPVYEYVCGGCKTEFQLRRPRVDNRKKASCPECGGDGKRRITEFGRKKDKV
ncbi:MAG: zinc ribbon domain-containing protein [Planctomycetota bacterium]|jgi:putative FmdB family regulatory protein